MDNVNQAEFAGISFDQIPKEVEERRALSRMSLGDLRALYDKRREELGELVQQTGRDVGPGLTNIYKLIQEGAKECQDLKEELQRRGEPV